MADGLPARPCCVTERCISSQAGRPRALTGEDACLPLQRGCSTASFRLSVHDVAQGVAIQGDGKIVVAGYTSTLSNTPVHTAVVRYDANGILDTSFGGSGKIITAVSASLDSGTSVAVQSDGKIVVAGASSNGSNSDFAMLRYHSNGTLDTSFNGSGIVTTDLGSNEDNARSLILQTDGKIVAAGYYSNGSNRDFAWVRYNNNGSLDTSMNGTGIITTAIGSGGDDAVGVAVQADGKIVVVGYSFNGSNLDFAVARYLGEPATYNAMIPAVEFLFGTVGGSTYSIEASFDLTTWTTIETNIAGTGGLISRLYSIRGQPKRFFRSRQD
jgi:uncharacterized delta-60 repeat protein